MNRRFPVFADMGSSVITLCENLKSVILVREYEIQLPRYARRKVRAPQGRMQEKILRVRTQGKCHRDIPPVLTGKGEKAG